MKRSKRMQPVRKLKAQEERQRAQKLAKAQQALAQENQQLQMLEKYQRDYFEGLSGGALRQGVTVKNAQDLDKYQMFLARLYKAIENQKQVIVIKEKSVEAARQEWADAHAQLKALDNLIERMIQEESKQLDKQEQRLIDDLPLRNNRYD